MIIKKYFDLGHPFANDPSMTLREWKQRIEELARIHGDDAIMYTDGGYNNVQMMLEVEDANN